MKRIIIYIVGIIVGISLLWIVANWSHIKAFPSIISAFYSKEFCSCYFVMERSEEICHNYARQYVPISDFSLDQENRTVTVKGLGRITTVQYQGERTGCVFE